jgi:outer membrane protein assembly factor BamE (lipoprotein component of BamABCDE complex)
MAFRLKYHSIFVYLFFVILTNCQFNESTNTHGILFLENRSNKLIVKKTNKNDVINIIGYPHSKSISNENEWIYIERVLTKGEYHKLGQNILKSNNVLYLVFDKYGVLENKELFKKEQINKIVFSKKETTNDLSKKSFIEGLFSSLKSKMYRRK